MQDVWRSPVSHLAHGSRVLAGRCGAAQPRRPESLVFLSHVVCFDLFGKSNMVLWKSEKDLLRISVFHVFMIFIHILWYHDIDVFSRMFLNHVLTLCEDSWFSLSQFIVPSQTYYRQYLYIVYICLFCWCLCYRIADQKKKWPCPTGADN